MSSYNVAETFLSINGEGTKAGQKDLEDSSVIRIPRIYRFIMKFVTPTLLLAIFLAWLCLLYTSRCV